MASRMAWTARRVKGSRCSLLTLDKTAPRPLTAGHHDYKLHCIQSRRRPFERNFLNIMIYGFAQQLREGKGLLGAWCTFASFASAEVMTNLGFDFLVLDMQHCELTQSQFPGILGAFKEGGPVPIVRVPQNDYHIINWLLDQGVGGVVAPMVTPVEDARRAVEAPKFPPVGRRSFGPYRAAAYSFNAP